MGFLYQQPRKPQPRPKLVNPALTIRQDCRFARLSEYVKQRMPRKIAMM
jgi:hypothetical protein